MAALAALAAAQPSQATVMQAVFQGSLTLDAFGTGADMFGLEQSQLLGQAFTMTFRYDTSLGQFGMFQDEAGLNGGPFSGTTSPVIFATVEINGVTLGIPAPIESSVSANIDALGRTPGESARAQGPFVINFDNASEAPKLSASVQKAGFPISLDFSTPFELHGGDVTHVMGSQVLLFQTGPDGRHAVDQIDVLGVATDLVVTRVPDSSGGAPELAAWALMIAGFGLAGTALRRRRGVSPSA